MRFQVPLYLHVISRFQPRVVSGHRSASLPRRFAAQERLAGIRFLLGEEPILVPTVAPSSRLNSLIGYHRTHYRTRFLERADSLLLAVFLLPRARSWCYWGGTQISAPLRSGDPTIVLELAVFLPP